MWKTQNLKLLKTPNPKISQFSKYENVETSKTTTPIISHFQKMKFSRYQNIRFWKNTNLEFQNITSPTFSFSKTANCTSQVATTFRFTVTEICRQIVKWMAPFKVGSRTGTEVRDERICPLGSAPDNFERRLPLNGFGSYLKFPEQLSAHRWGIPKHDSLC